MSSFDDLTDPDLLKALERLGPTLWSGTAYRAMAPRWTSDPLSGKGAYIAGGRWNPAEAFPCIYLAGSVETCVAELRRRAEGQARGVESLLPQTLLTVETAEVEVLDLTSEAALHRVRLSLTDIQSDDRTACQKVGAAAHFLGYQGIRALSATGNGFIIAAFERHLRLGQLTVVSREQLDVH